LGDLRADRRLACWAKSSQQSRLAQFSHSKMQRERDDATLPKIWTPREHCDRSL
jgi:hypothetical protein